MLTFHVKFVQIGRQTDGQTYGWTDRWTTVKQCAPNLLMRGHKKTNHFDLLLFNYCSEIHNTEFNFTNPFPKKPWFSRVCSTKCSENTIGKGEITHNEQFLLFPQSFLPIFENFWRFCQISKLLAANSLSLEESKICGLEKG